ncbi:MAG: BON domain-containing protein [Micavibrio sp.]|nr:BON domain-containing protein [Micavibrio sp.]
MNKNILILLASSAVLLSGCTGAAIGAGATLGVAASQEGGISGAATDARIQLEINNLWLNYSVEAFRKLDLTVNMGRVLVTGVVQDPEQRVEAIRLAWQPKGVEQVINEVQVAKSPGVAGFAKDTWISTRLRSSITFDKDILSINYSIDTVNGSVYLMGFAQSRSELNRVIQHARKIPGVVNVVSYVKIVSGDASARAQSWQDVVGSDATAQSQEPTIYSVEPESAAPMPTVEAETLAPIGTVSADTGGQDTGQNNNSVPYIERDQPTVSSGGEEIQWD